MLKKILAILLSTLLLFSFFPVFIVCAIPPSSHPLYLGIDVSFYQEDIDFEQVADSGIQVVYIRSSLGGDYIDPKFEDNYAKASAAGLSIGFYHYVTARSISQAQYQAQFFVNTIQDKDFDCRLAMDFEDLQYLTDTEINAIGLAFIQTVEQLRGKKAVVYSDSYNAGYTFSGAITAYPLWVAEYGAASPSDNSNWSFWVGWQHSDTGRIPGISTNVDLDYFTDGIFLDNSGPVNPVPPPPEPSTSYVEYRVKSGDTLWNIAQLYHTSITAIANENALANPNLIYPGQILRIPIPDNTPSEDTYLTYTVKPGDTLWAISRNYHTSIADLVKLNQIHNENLIYPGQKLRIPCTPDSGSSKPVQWYTVKSGDTLWAIAAKYNTTISALVSVNHISNPNFILIGQKLQIPS